MRLPATTPAAIALLVTATLAGCGGRDAPDAVPAGAAQEPAGEPLDLPTIDEAQEQASETIDETNLDEAVRRLEEELDAETDGSSP